MSHKALPDSVRGSFRLHRLLLATGVLGHGLGALADCVFAQLARQVKSDGRLDLAAGDGVLLVVVGQAGRLGGDALEDVVHEGVHDAHGLAGDASVGMDLLQDLVDVDRVALLARLFLRLPTPFDLGSPHSWLLFSLLGGYFSRHDVQRGKLFRPSRLCRSKRSSRQATLDALYFRIVDHFT